MSSIYHGLYISCTSVAKVGIICCRIENEDDQTSLYIMTMGVLAVSQFSPSKVTADPWLTQPSHTDPEGWDHRAFNQYLRPRKIILNPKSQKSTSMYKCPMIQPKPSTNAMDSSKWRYTRAIIGKSILMTPGCSRRYFEYKPCRCAHNYIDVSM